MISGVRVSAGKPRVFSGTRIGAGQGRAERGCLRAPPLGSCG